MSNTVEARYRLAHAEQPALLRTVQDIDSLIDDLLTDAPEGNLAQLHSRERDLLPSGRFDHELLVGANSSLQVGVVAYMSEEGSLVTVGSPTGRTDPTYSIMGYGREFLGNVEIPVDLVRRAIKEFLVSGGQRPACVEWQEDW